MTTNFELKNNIKKRRRVTNLHKEERNNEVKRMLDEGKTFSEISEKFKFTRERVRQIANLFGVYRNIDKKAQYETIIKSIEFDMNNEFSYEEIINKYKLNRSIIYNLEKRGLPSLFNFFKNKRDQLILEEFKKGASANSIINSDNKFLKINYKITTVDMIYKIAVKNNLYKQPKIGNRNKGGCFEDESILKFIKTMRDEKKLTFEEIKNTLNRTGKRTINGATFSNQNVVVKYNKAKLIV